jgi:hypothetical protein
MVSVPFGKMMQTLSVSDVELELELEEESEDVEIIDEPELLLAFSRVCNKLSDLLSAISTAFLPRNLFINL